MRLERAILTRTIRPLSSGIRSAPCITGKNCVTNSRGAISSAGGRLAGVTANRFWRFSDLGPEIDRSGRHSATIGGDGQFDFSGVFSGAGATVGVETALTSAEPLAGDSRGADEVTHLASARPSVSRAIAATASDRRRFPVATAG